MKTTHTKREEEVAQRLHEAHGKPRRWLLTVLLGVAITYFPATQCGKAIARAKYENRRWGNSSGHSGKSYVKDSPEVEANFRKVREDAKAYRDANP